MKQNLPRHFALSPDGRTIVVNGGAKGAGLYDWRTGQMRYVPLPAGFDGFGWGSYSPDGKNLVGVAGMARQHPQVTPGMQLGIIDLATQKTATFSVLSDTGVFRSPVFRPDGRAVLYVGSGETLFLFDLKTKNSRALLSAEDGFASIDTPSFVSADTVFFVGMGPRNSELKETVKRLGAKSTFVPIPYVLRVGLKPEVAYLDFVKSQLSDRYGELPSLMPASRNGERIAFISLSGSESARKAYLSGDLARRDIFVMEHGRVRQVTHLENYMAYCAISDDGSTAAFGLYTGPVSDVRSLGRGRIPLELTIVDLNTGQVTHTDFLRRVYSVASN
ncbi:MAG: WD40 repeat domain-containing protein [Reyranella sp.]